MRREALRTGLPSPPRLPSSPRGAGPCSLDQLLSGGPGLRGGAAPTPCSDRGGGQGHGRSWTGQGGWSAVSIQIPMGFDLIFFSLPPRLPNSTAPMSALLSTGDVG